MIEPENKVKLFISSTEFLYSKLVLTQEKCNFFYNVFFSNILHLTKKILSCMFYKRKTHYSQKKRNQPKKNLFGN